MTSLQIGIPLRPQNQMEMASGPLSADRSRVPYPRQTQGDSSLDPAVLQVENWEITNSPIFLESMCRPWASVITIPETSYKPNVQLGLVALLKSQEQESCEF